MAKVDILVASFFLILYTHSAGEHACAGGKPGAFGLWTGAWIQSPVVHSVTPGE
jgi:hypothetical protein